ncbi:MAG: cupin domain-containing protein [Novosphingobium sp.]|nr:cupin domain-containing protein [Novosphingobium sp.]
MTDSSNLVGPVRMAHVVLPVLAMLSGCEQEPMKMTEPTPKPGVELAFDVPQEATAQIVHVVTRDIPAGAAIPWHTHPGVEMAYVESGDLELELAGQDAVRLAPGDNFTVLRGTVHSGKNVGEESARLVLTYVVDKDALLRSPADPPGD